MHGIKTVRAPVNGYVTKKCFDQCIRFILPTMYLHVVTSVEIEDT